MKRVVLHQRISTKLWKKEKLTVDIPDIPNTYGKKKAPPFHIKLLKLNDTSNDFQHYYVKFQIFKKHKKIINKLSAR